MKITTRQINNAIANGYAVEVVINGEYYELDKIEDFNDGVRFAAAIIEDRRARNNGLFEGYQTISKKPITKKAIEINAARNQEVEGAIDLLNNVLTGGSFKYWFDDFKNNRLWKLKRG